MLGLDAGWVEGSLSRGGEIGVETKRKTKEGREETMLQFILRINYFFKKQENLHFFYNCFFIFLY